MNLLAWSRTASASRERSSSITKRRKASSFEEYWLASKAWERHGLTAAAARALVHYGFLNLADLQGAHDLECNRTEARPKELGRTARFDGS